VDKFSIYLASRAAVIADDHLRFRRSQLDVQPDVRNLLTPPCSSSALHAEPQPTPYLLFLQRCIIQLLHRSLFRDDALPVGAAAALAHRALPTYRLAAAVCILHVAPQRALAEASIAAALSCTMARPMDLRYIFPHVCTRHSRQVQLPAELHNLPFAP